MTVQLLNQRSADYKIVQFALCWLYNCAIGATLTVQVHNCVFKGTNIGEKQSISKGVINPYQEILYPYPYKLIGILVYLSIFILPIYRFIHLCIHGLSTIYLY